VGALSTLLERMSVLLEDFVQRESQNESVVGILVFGSFVKGGVRATSDLDLLVMREDIEEYSRTRQTEKGILLEIHRWPLKIFAKPFSGESGNPFTDAFCFDVMRRGRILYDLKGALRQFKRYAQTHKFPSSHVKSFVDKAHESLRLAKILLEKKELEGAELELRKASEELARAILLETDVLEIIPPKCYLPHLRKTLSFYSTFREVHNLENLSKDEIEAAIQNISEWRERMVEEIRRAGKEDWVKLGGAIHGAQSELSNAQDCLMNGDLEAAVLQVRYSAMLVASPIVRLLQGTSANTPSMRYMRILQSKHPYGYALKSVMNFSNDKRRMKEQIEILEDTIERYE